VDIRTLFLAQTCALAATALMLWLARSPADRHNGLHTWMLASGCQALAYLLLANQGRLPVPLTAATGNALGAVSLALFFVAIRQFLGLRFKLAWLLVMVLAVTAVATVAGRNYASATIFNGFVYGWMGLLNARALWREPAADLIRLQRVVAACYLLMGLVLPLRATGLWLAGQHADYLTLQIDWQQPLYVFGFLYITVTNLGFLQMCKMRAEIEVRKQSLTDGLTGLTNRRGLDAAMQRALAAAKRSSNSNSNNSGGDNAGTAQAFAVLMLDLDHFKLINDRFGHQAGDAALRAFAQRLQAGLREQDQAFRYGGEEFCVLLPGTDDAAALLLAERLRLQVVLPAQGERPLFSASFGVAVWQPGDTADTLFKRADRALYRAKNSGRNRVDIEGL
jgi:diguanylate cyclase (GGDEF)-like protein